MYLLLQNEPECTIFRQFSENFPGEPPPRTPTCGKGNPALPLSALRASGLRLQTLVLQQFWIVLQRKKSWTPLTTVPWTYKQSANFYLKFGSWSYNNQTWTVSLSKGLLTLHWHHIPLGDGQGQNVVLRYFAIIWLCCRLGQYPCFSNTCLVNLVTLTLRFNLLLKNFNLGHNLERRFARRFGPMSLRPPDVSALGRFGIGRFARRFSPDSTLDKLRLILTMYITLPDPFSIRLLKIS